MVIIVIVKEGRNPDVLSPSLLLITLNAWPIHFTLYISLWLCAFLWSASHIWAASFAVTFAAVVGVAGFPVDLAKLFK